MIKLMILSIKNFNFNCKQNNICKDKSIFSLILNKNNVKIKLFSLKNKTYNKLNLKKKLMQISNKNLMIYKNKNQKKLKKIIQHYKFFKTKLILSNKNLLLNKIK